MEVARPKFQMMNWEACAFGENLCQKTAKDGAGIQRNDSSANGAMMCIGNDISSSDLIEEELSPGMDVNGWLNKRN